MLFTYIVNFINLDPLSFRIIVITQSIHCCVPKILAIRRWIFIISSLSGKYLSAERWLRWGLSRSGCCWLSSSSKSLCLLGSAQRTRYPVELRGAGTRMRRPAGGSSPQATRCSARGTRETSGILWRYGSHAKTWGCRSNTKLPAWVVNTTPNLRAARATSSTPKASGNKWPAHSRNWRANCAGTSLRPWRLRCVSAHRGMRTSSWTSVASWSPVALESRALLHLRRCRAPAPPPPPPARQLARSARTTGKRLKSTAAAPGPVCALSSSPCCRVTTARFREVQTECRMSF